MPKFVCTVADPAINLERLGHEGDRRCIVPKLIVQEPQQLQGVKVIRLRLQNRAIGAFRFPRGTNYLMKVSPWQGNRAKQQTEAACPGTCHSISE